MSDVMNGRVEEDGNIHWYKDGVLHREDGPEVIWANGAKQWWHRGQMHREDGPAKETPNGNNEWWLSGAKLTEDEFNLWRSKKDLNEKLHITLEQKTITKRVKL